MTYDEWIADWASKQRIIRGACGRAVNAMVEAFPELKRVAGWVIFTGGSSEHFWCVAPDGSIVDPTFSQFSGKLLRYQEFQPGDEVRVGRCLNCGDGIFAQIQGLDDRSAARSVCTPECAQALEASLSFEAFEAREAVT